MKTLPLYKKFAETKAIAYYPMSNFGGIEILSVWNLIDDYVIACFNFGTGRQQIRRHKVYVTPSCRVYIRKQGVRYYLDQFMKA